MAYHNVLVTREGSIARITLNRPEALNSFTFPFIDEFCQVCAELAEPAVRAVVVAGAGRAFSAGDDLKNMRVPEHFHTIDRGRLGYPRMLRAVRELEKPVIARLQGHAMGAGCDLALACDYRIAAAGTQMALPFVKRGMAAGTYLLAQLIGVSRAVPLLFEGESFSVEDAHAWGLVHQVVPLDALDAAVDALAARLAGSPTKALAAAKRALYSGWGKSLEEGLFHQGIATAATLLTEDVVEGKRAFAEKREPRFRGR